MVGADGGVGEFFGPMVNNMIMTVVNFMNCRTCDTRNTASRGDLFLTGIRTLASSGRAARYPSPSSMHSRRFSFRRERNSFAMSTGNRVSFFNGGGAIKSIRTGMRIAIACRVNGYSARSPKGYYPIDEVNRAGVINVLWGSCVEGLGGRMEAVYNYLVYLITKYLISYGSPSSVRRSSLGSVRVLGISTPLGVACSSIISDISCVTLRSRGYPVKSVEGVGQSKGHLFIRSEKKLCVFSASNSFVSGMKRGKGTTRRCVGVSTICLSGGGGRIYVIADPGCGLLACSCRNSFVSIRPLPRSTNVVSSIDSLNSNDLVTCGMLSCSIEAHLTRCMLCSFSSSGMRIVPLLGNARISDRSTVCPFLCRPVA